MRIIKINIKCFGKLKDFTLEPTEGVNIIYGENESGKSTVMAFIKAMFYGLGTGEKRRQYEPWDGGQPQGSIEFESDGYTYLLSRTFGPTKAADKISLFDKTLGENVDLPGGMEPGAHILGINIKTFVNTVFIGQAGTAVEGENHEIIQKLTNLTSSGDERISKGEVEKRLKNGAASLESRKSTAILPELRKQKHELMESRLEIQKSLNETDDLRDVVAAAQKKQRSLQKEKQFLTDTANRLAMQAELKEIYAIVEKHDALTAMEEKYGELDAFFNGDSSDSMSEFLESAVRLLDEEKSKEIELKEKKKQLAALKKSYENIDTSKLAMVKVINKYSREIVSAFERYDSLIAEKSEMEIALENSEREERESNDFLLRAAICAAVVVGTLLLGFLFHWVFFILGGLALVSLMVYFFVYKRGFEVEGVSDERISLNNINEDLRSLNAEMRPIFENFSVRSMEEFDREYKAIDSVQKQHLDYKKQRDALKKEIDEANDELDDIRGTLRENLAMYHETQSNEEAFEIISRLRAMKQQYDKLTAEVKAARETFDFMLNGRDYDALAARGQRLRGDINLEVPESFTAEKVRSKLEDTEKKLGEINEVILRQETELSLKPYSPQDMERADEEIKALAKRIEHYEFELEAINEAQLALDEAFHEMQLDFGPMINYRASRVLSGMTGQKYSSVFVSEKLVPTVAESGSSQPRNCDILSAGTFDQIYLSLRLALSGVVADEKLPIMLDDSFTQFDDDRMEQALAFIKEDNALGELGQTVIFTCHKRVLRAAKKLEMTDGIFRME